jgi:hypothetical protein
MGEGDQMIDPRNPTIEKLENEVDDLVAVVKALEEEVERLREENNTLRRIPKGEVWYYGDDGQDYPESLGCPVIMEPSILRRLLAAEAIVEPLEELLAPYTYVELFYANWVGDEDVWHYEVRVDHEHFTGGTLAEALAAAVEARKASES